MFVTVYKKKMMTMMVLQRRWRERHISSHQGYAPVISTSYARLVLIKVTFFWMSSRRGGGVSWEARRGLERQAYKIVP